MPFDANDPALAAVENRLRRGMGGTDAYYDVFQPRRGLTITQRDYCANIRPHVVGLAGPFTRTEVQGDTFVPYTSPAAAFDAWARTDWDFLHIHRGAIARYRVYIPADLRHVGAIVDVLWAVPSLTGFKIAAYADANNRSDVMIGWVLLEHHVAAIADSIPTNWLHGMRPPGSSIIRMGCQIGYSQEVQGSSVGTEVVHWLNRI